MRKCPLCRSVNVRRSKHHFRRRLPRQVFAAWFRCRDCSARFLDTDWALVGKCLTVPLGIGALLWVRPWLLPDRSPVPAQPYSSGASPAVSAPPPSLPVDSLLLTEDDLRHAAEHGDLDAQYRHGLRRLQAHQETGDTAALYDAVNWLKRAAEGGHGRAELTMGALYEKGRGVVQDYAQAAQWYQRAAESGEPEAMLRLGQMTEAGRGVQKDPQQAYLWLNLATARGEARAELSRDRVQSQLSQAEIIKAQELARRLDAQIPRPESRSNGHADAR